MFNILTLNKIAAVGLDQLGDNYTITDDVNTNADGIVLRSFKMHDMELPETLLAVARAGAGVNNIPIDKCTEKGIVVFNTPGANANAVKELVIAGLLLSSRDIVEGIEWASTLNGDDIDKQVEKGKSHFAGNEIMGKTLGVIGLGAIGILVANAAVALGMDVVGYDPFLSVANALKLSEKVKVVKNIDDIYKVSDYVTIHVPLTDETRDSINAEAIAKMKDGVRILNFARGGLVNADDVKAAIAEGKVAKYVVDFPGASAVSENGILAIPHLGASTEESEDNCAVMACQEIADYLENGNIVNSVNFPRCWLQKSAGGRVAIIHKNIPNAIAKYTDVITVNISDMMNASKGDIAYTIINTDEPIPAEVMEKLSNTSGVIKARLIK